MKQQDVVTGGTPEPGWAAKVPSWSLWAYVVLFASAEYLVAHARPAVGLSLYALLLLALLIQSAFGRTGAVTNLTLALVLVPLLRILSLTVPLTLEPFMRLFALKLPISVSTQLFWYPLIAVPLLVSTWLIVRLLHLSQDELSLNIGNPVVQVGFGLVGFGLGAFAYLLLRPAPLTASSELREIMFVSLVLILVTGLTEELIFRGVLQSLAVPALGRVGIVYVALVFAVLHIGYVSAGHVVLVLGAGLLFGAVVYWTGSILGTTLAHYLTNLTLYVLAPYLFEHASSDQFTQVGRVLGVLTGVGVFTFCMLFVRRLLGDVATSDRASSVGRASES